MIIYFTLENGYLNGYSSTPNHTPEEIKLEIPNDHELFSSDSHIFKYENGELIKDEEHRKQLIAEEEERKNRPSDEEMNAVALMELTEFMMGGK